MAFQYDDDTTRWLCLTNLFCWSSLVCYSLYFTGAIPMHHIISIMLIIIMINHPIVIIMIIRLCGSSCLWRQPNSPARKWGETLVWKSDLCEILLLEENEITLLALLHSHFVGPAQIWRRSKVCMLGHGWVKHSTIFLDSIHTSYLSFLLHGQDFWVNFCSTQRCVKCDKKWCCVKTL